MRTNALGSNGARLRGRTRLAGPALLREDRNVHAEQEAGARGAAGFQERAPRAREVDDPGFAHRDLLHASAFAASLIAARMRT